MAKIKLRVNKFETLAMGQDEIWISDEFSPAVIPEETGIHQAGTGPAERGMDLGESRGDETGGFMKRSDIKLTHYRNATCGKNRDVVSTLDNACAACIDW